MAEKMRPSAHSFFRSSAALGLYLLTLTEGRNVAGDMCDGQAMPVHKGEVVIVCPVTADINQTKHSVVIKHFNQANTAEDVLGCDWLSYLQRFDCLRSRVGAELIEIQTDRILVRLPEERLQRKGSYDCQLVPPDPKQVFTKCNICFPDVPKDTLTTDVSLAVTPSTAVDHHESDEPKAKTSGCSNDPQKNLSICADGYRGNLVIAVVVLSLTVWSLLLSSCASQFSVCWWLWPPWFSTYITGDSVCGKNQTTPTRNESHYLSWIQAVLRKQRQNLCDFCLLTSSESIPGRRDGEKDKRRTSNYS